MEGSPGFGRWKRGGAYMIHICPIFAYSYHIFTLITPRQPKSRLIAYYCRQYAVELALPLLKSAKDPAAKTTLLAIMSTLETEKTAVGDAFTKVEAYAVTRDFSNAVLSQADRSYAATFAADKRDYAKAKVR